MKGAFVSRAMSAALVVAVLALGACDDNPLDFDPQDTTSLSMNPTFMVVPAGRTAELDVRALNDGNEPTFAEVSSQANACGGPASVTVADNPARTPVEPPGRFLVTAGNTIGASCIIVAAGGVTDTVEVVVVADAVEITSDHSAAVRAGEGGTVTVQIIASDGSPVTPFDVADVTFASSDATIVDIAADGTFTTSSAGTATITVTWSGTDATGTSGLGVVRTATVPITVVPNVPVSVAVDVVGNSFGAFSAAQDSTVEVIVSDALGNQNTNPDELVAITAQSSDETVATVEFERVETIDPSTFEVTAVNFFLTVTAVGGGEAEITGTVETTVGDFPFGPISITVLSPNIVAVAPNAGAPGSTVTITGTGLAATGFPTSVIVNGFPGSEVTDTTAVALVVDLLPFGNGGALEVVVIVGGVASNVATFTEAGAYDAETSEPENDNPATPQPIGLPFDATGVLDDTDVDDFFLITLAAGATVVIDLGWDTAEDLDILVTDAAFTAFVCTDGATVAQPEQSVCAMPAGGSLLWLNNFSATGPANYAVQAAIP